jgi:hypothetical protein
LNPPLQADDSPQMKTPRWAGRFNFRELPT